MRAAIAALLACSWVSACAGGGTSAGDAGRFDAGAVDGPLDCAGLTYCAPRCVDLSSDVQSCGACDRTCVVPHASAACVGGECAVEACEEGRLDCNGDPNDGCEVSADCSEGASCTTSCGTEGVQRCADACAPLCAPPAELCNLVDDDCDGACEVGLPGCRRPVHRSNGPNGHFYTIDMAEASCCGMRVESYGFFHLYTSMADGTQPLFRCLAPDGHHFYTTDTGCEAAGGLEGTMGFIAMTERCGATPLYRLSQANGDHFYTVSAPERDSAVGLGYRFVGITGYVWSAP